MTDAQNTADMVEDDGLVRERARQIDEVGKLRMEVPGIEGEAELGQFGEAFAPAGLPVTVVAAGLAESL